MPDGVLQISLQDTIRHELLFCDWVIILSTAMLVNGIISEQKRLELCITVVTITCFWDGKIYNGVEEREHFFSHVFQRGRHVSFR